MVLKRGEIRPRGGLFALAGGGKKSWRVAFLLSLSTVLMFSGCGGGPTTPATPTPPPTYGTVTGTAVVDTGTVSSAAAPNVQLDTRAPTDLGMLPRVPDRIVVKLRPLADMNALDALVRSVGGTIVEPN